MKEYDNSPYGWVDPGMIFDSDALNWLNQHFADVKPSGTIYTMEELDEVGEGENVIPTEDGPLMASDAIRRYLVLLSKLQSGLIDYSGWLDQIKESKGRFLQALLNLEISLLFDRHGVSRYNRESGFRKNGVMVLREKQRELAAA